MEYRNGLKGLVVRLLIPSLYGWKSSEPYPFRFRFIFEFIKYSDLRDVLQLFIYKSILPIYNIKLLQ